MNILLKDVICTSKDGDRFWKISECYIQGNSIKYLRLPEEIVSLVEEEANNQLPSGNSLHPMFLNYNCGQVTWLPDEGEAGVALVAGDAGGMAHLGAVAGVAVVSKVTAQLILNTWHNLAPSLLGRGGRTDGGRFGPPGRG